MDFELKHALDKLTDREKELVKNYYLVQNVSNRVRSQFTKEEDKKLIDLVKKYTADNFSAIAKELPGRSVRQCRERWKHYLSPSVRNTPWTEEEDNLLRAKYCELGPKWVEISAFFHNRTDVNIKNRWIVLMRKDSKMIVSVAQYNALKANSETEAPEPTSFAEFESFPLDLDPNLQLLDQF